jgi:hypothetical protein
MSRSQSSSSRSVSDPIAAIPAELTSTSTWPNVSKAVSRRFTSDSRSRTFAVTSAVSTPISAISAVVSATFDSLVLVAITSAPSSANPSAIALPIPLVPPMTTADLSATVTGGCSLISLRRKQRG